MLDPEKVKEDLTKAISGKNPVLVTKEQEEILASIVVSYILLAENPEDMSETAVQKAMDTLDIAFNSFIVVTETDTKKLH